MKTKSQTTEFKSIKSLNLKGGEKLEHTTGSLWKYIEYDHEENMHLLECIENVTKFQYKPGQIRRINLYNAEFSIDWRLAAVEDAGAENTEIVLDKTDLEDVEYAEAVEIIEEAAKEVDNAIFEAIESDSASVLEYVEAIVEKAKEESAKIKSIEDAVKAIEENDKKIAALESEIKAVEEAAKIKFQGTVYWDAKNKIKGILQTGFEGEHLLIFKDHWGEYKIMKADLNDIEPYAEQDLLPKFGEIILLPDFAQTRVIIIGLPDKGTELFEIAVIEGSRAGNTHYVKIEPGKFEVVKL